MCEIITNWYFIFFENIISMVSFFPELVLFLLNTTVTQMMLTAMLNQGLSIHSMAIQ